MHIHYLVCYNNCICFVKYLNKTTFLYYMKVKYDIKGLLYKILDYLSIIHQFQLFWANPTQMLQLKSYWLEFQALPTSNNIIEDF